MIAYLNTTTGVLSATQGGAALSRAEAKRGATWDLEVIPDEEIPAGSVGHFSAKSVYGGALLAHGAWSAPTVSGRGWLFSLSMSGSGLAALFSGTTDEVPLLAEGTFTIGGKTRKSQTIDLVVERDIFTGTEDQPAELAAVIRIGATGHMEYYVGGQWWRRTLVLNAANQPEEQWIGPIT